MRPYIIAIAIAAAVSANAWAQQVEEDSTDVFYRHLDLKEVVVMGATGSIKLKDSSLPVTMLTSRQMHQIGSTNVIDAIASLPGVSQVTTGANISKPVIRGLGYNRIVTVNDGMRQEGQQWGDEHGIEIDAESVGSVEVLKGPGSLIYGSDALAGVIKFNSYPIVPLGKLRFQASTEYQTNNGLFGYSLNHAGNKGGNVWDIRFSNRFAHAYKNRRDGRVPNSQFSEHAFRAMGGINRHWGHSRLIISHFHSTPSIIEGERDILTGELICPYGKTTQYSHGLPYQQVIHNKAVLDNTFAIGNGSLYAVLGYQINARKEFEEESAPEQAGIVMKLHTVNYNCYYVLPVAAQWKHTIGVGGMYQKSVNKGAEFLIPDYNLFDVGTYFTTQRNWGQWTLNGGVRYDHRHLHALPLTDDGEERFAEFKRDFGSVAASLGAVFHVNDQLDMRINLARGIRMPGINELASNGLHEGTMRYEVGNSGLKMENSLQGDLGLEYASSKLNAQVAFFASGISNYVYLYKTTETIGDEAGVMPIYRFTQDKSRLIGGEASIDFHPIHSLHLGSTFGFVNAFMPHHDKESKYLPFTPAPRLTGEIKYEFNHHSSTFCNIFMAVQVDYNFRQNHYLMMGGTETPTPDYLLLNCSAGTDISFNGKHVATLAIVGQNLTDKVYQNHLSRLKYCDVNPTSGRQGVSNMGRNVVVKLNIPIEF